MYVLEPIFKKCTKSVSIFARWDQNRKYFLGFNKLYKKIILGYLEIYLSQFVSWSCQYLAIPGTFPRILWNTPWLLQGFFLQLLWRFDQCHLGHISHEVEWMYWNLFLTSWWNLESNYKIWYILIKYNFLIIYFFQIFALFLLKWYLSGLLWKKKCSSGWEKLLKLEAEGLEFAKCLRSLQQFIQTVKGQNNFW